MAERLTTRDIKSLAKGVSSEVMKELTEKLAPVSAAKSPCLPTSAFTECGTYDCEGSGAGKFKCSPSFACTGTFTELKKR